MRTCSRCGCYLPDGVTICLACGTHQGKTGYPTTSTSENTIESCRLGDSLIELSTEPVEWSTNPSIKAVDINTIHSSRRCGTCSNCEIFTCLTADGEEIIYRCNRNFPVLINLQKENYGCGGYQRGMPSVWQQG